MSGGEKFLSIWGYFCAILFVLVFFIIAYCVSRSEAEDDQWFCCGCQTGFDKGLSKDEALAQHKELHPDCNGEIRWNVGHGSCATHDDKPSYD